MANEFIQHPDQGFLVLGGGSGSNSSLSILKNGNFELGLLDWGT